MESTTKENSSTTEKFLIRTAVARDAEILARLSYQTFVEAFADQNTEENMAQYLSKNCTTPVLTEELKNDYSTFLIAEKDGEAVGFAQLLTIEIPEELKNKRVIEIHRLYVLKKMIGRKIGKALMEECLKRAKQNKFETIWLGVWERNAHAIAFYEKFGFEVFGSHIFEVGWDPQTDLLMKKEL